MVKEKTAKTKLDKGLNNKPGGTHRKTKKRFNSILSLRRFLATVINDLNNGEIDENRARCMAYLCDVMRNFIKDSSLEERILKLEKALDERD
ncbi:MAG: hypothetical protein PVG39_26345 [Desulfobacteraceae bacterium]|jgi:hypothetical protein